MPAAWGVVDVAAVHYAWNGNPMGALLRYPGANSLACMRALTLLLGPSSEDLGFHVSGASNNMRLPAFWWF